MHSKPSFFFVFYIIIPVSFNNFLYDIMKWNIAKIKNHNYDVLCKFCVRVLLLRKYLTSKIKKKFRLVLSLEF